MYRAPLLTRVATRGVWASWGYCMSLLLPLLRSKRYGKHNTSTDPCGPWRHARASTARSTGGLGRSVESKSCRRGDKHKELLLQSQQPSADGLRVRPSAMTNCCCACHNSVMFPEYSPSAFGRLQLRGGYRLKVTLFRTCYFEACNLYGGHCLKVRFRPDLARLPQSQVQTRRRRQTMNEHTKLGHAAVRPHNSRRTAPIPAACTKIPRAYLQK